MSHKLVSLHIGDGEYYTRIDADNVLAEKDKVIAELNDKLQYVSELLKETRYCLIDSQKLHKRCADNAVKVIAELQAQKAQAEDDCAFWKTLAQKKRNLTQPTDRSKDNKTR